MYTRTNGFLVNRKEERRQQQQWRGLVEYTGWFSRSVFSFLKKIVFCLPFLASKASCKSVVDKLAVNSSRLYIWTTGNFIGWVIEKIEVFVETTCSLSRAGNIFSIILSCGISRHSQDKGGIREGMGNFHIDTIHKQIKIFDN